MMEAVRFGAGPVNSLPGMGPTAMADYAKSAERLGYHFLTLFDHVVMAYPSTDGTPRALYPPKTPYHDVLVALGHLAAVTSSIRLRTSVLLLPQRGPVVTAKQVASADGLSGGRVEVGLGVGWQEAEYEALNVPFRERGRRMDEGIELMKRLWTQARVDFAGHYYRVDGMAMEPKPLQRPHPPLWFGGTTERAFRRVASHGVGWLSRPVQTMEEIEASWAWVRDLVSKAGRDPDAIRLQTSIPLGPEESTEETLDLLGTFLAIGATDVVINTSYAPGITRIEDHVAQLERAKQEILPRAVAL